MPDIETLSMALIGYREERRKIDSKIAELEARLTGRTTVSENAGTARPKRQMSKAAKARIAEAQRKRWAAFRKQKGKTAPGAKRAATARKPVSAEVRQKRVAALAKARAARAAKRNAVAASA